MRDFITGLQFLTRIRIFPEDNWTADSFGRSIKYFSLVGLVIGLVLAGINILLLTINCGDFLRAGILICAELMITGGLMADGYMDTADGVFSGRSKERKLEIMKDSCVGANGVVAFVMLVMLQFSVYVEIVPEKLTLILCAMPIITRGFMVVLITHFPYARLEGIGKLFTQYARKSYAYFAMSVAIMLLLLIGVVPILLASVVCVFCEYWVANYFSKQLGGLTGDTYGALTEVGSICFLLAVYVLGKYF